MWSPRAEQIVSRLTASLPPDQLDPERTHAARLAALPIGVSMWADYYLRSNGEVVVVGDDFDHPDVDTIHTDWSTVRRVLVWGAKRYPELRELLPVRGPGATDCPTCQAIPLFGEGRVLCPTCDGLHWLPPATPDLHH
jgi:glycine/D-amino acid oxidase-like deaminating enzyme